MFELIRQIYLSLSKKRKLSSFFLIFLMVISSISELVSIALFIPLISVVIGNTKFEEIKLFSFFDTYFGEFNLVFIMVLIFTLSLFIRIFTLSWQNIFAANATNEIVYKAYNALLNEDYESHIKKPRSNLVATIHSNGNKLLIEVIRPILLLTESYIFISLVAIFLFLYNWRLFISIFFILFIIYNFFIVRANKKLKINGKKQVELNQKLLTILDIDLNSIEYINLGNYQKQSSNNYAKYDKKYKLNYSTYSIISRLPKILIEYIFLTVIVILIIFSYLSNTLFNVIPIFASGALLAFKLLPYLQRVFENWSQLVNFKDSAFTVINYARKYKINDDQKFANYELIDFKRLQFKNVNFSYEDKSNIFNEINLSIKKGEKIAIMGPSGTGKTTIMRLLLGLLIPSSGKILVNEKEINRKINYKHTVNWMRSVGYVPQKINLTGNTLRENIIFGSKSNNKNQISIDDVIKITLLDDLVKRCNGLDTNILENSFSLSGGESQRLAIARAIYRNPKLLIMDEPTSSLDNNTQKMIFENLFKLKDMTYVVITHRYETKYFFNRIIEIKDKNIIDNYNRN